MKPVQTMREIAEKLAADIRFHYRPITSENMIPMIESALTQVAKQAREEALEQVLAGIAREQQYHEFLEEKHAEMRHPVLACKEIASYVRALAAPSKEGK